MSTIAFPVAIVGISCRLPGGVTRPEDLWTIMEQGRDAVTEIPASRWSRERFLHPRRAMPGRGVSAAAGIVEHLDSFDAEFFGISRKEAEAMDPQQRLMLELAWEVCEDALIPPSALAGSDTAVFVGAASPDAGTSHADDICATSAHSMTGTNLSIISNRISYIFDFHGPSMTIDTACSSALHALHQACQTLAAGGARLALAGGVNLLFSPYPFVGFSQAHMLSPDGRCKVFDAEGDGYARAEGGGLLLLQPLEDALAAGRRIHGVIRAVGLNSDGRTRGISMPSAEAQEDLLLRVYDGAGIGPDGVAYVEAHGTGTAVGDPLEALAIGRALGARRSRPLLTGSVKCHVGHLETASAMAGITKALLVLGRRRVPPQIHISRLNPAIDFKGLNLRVPLRMTALPRTPGLPLAGVNSFGFGGANGHVLLQAPPPAPRRAARPAARLKGLSAAAPLLLSARSEESLRLLAGRYAEILEREPHQLYDLAAGLERCREAMPHRLAVAAPDAAACAAELRAVAEGGAAQAGEGAGQPQNGMEDAAAAPLAARVWSQLGGCVVPVGPRAPRALTAFVYSGNGSQWAGMGRALLEADRAFARAVEQSSACLRALCGADFAAMLARGVTEAELERTEAAQPLLFVMQVGLTAALRAKGLFPDMVFGHSVGEVAAAWACGALSLEQAALVVHHRSMLQGRTRGLGRMAALNIGPEEAEALAPVRRGLLDVAGVNARGSVTLAGDARALSELGEEMRSRGVFFRELPLDYAFHSRSMDGIEPPLRAALQGLAPRKGKIPFISGVTGARLDGRKLNADYWWNNIRRPVLFARAVETACGNEARLFMEVGPHQVLQHYLRQGLRACRAEGGVIGAQTREADCARQLRHAWTRAWTMGWPLRRQALFPAPGQAMPLPLYPWNRRPMSLEPTPECAGLLRAAPHHPLLGWRKAGQDVWENTLDLQLCPWLEDHRVGEAVFFPAAAYVEMALAAARLARPAWKPLELVNTLIRRPLIFRPDAPLNIRVSVDHNGEVRLAARPHMRGEAWTLHAKARVAESHAPSPLPCAATISPEDFGEERAVSALYDLTLLANMRYGPAFRPVERLWRRGGSILARLAPPQAAREGMLMPPPLLDGGLQLIFALIEDQVRQSPAPRLPYWFERCTLFRPGAPAFALARLEGSTPRTVACSLDLLDDEGRVLLRLAGGRARLAERLAAPGAPEAYAEFLVPAPHPLERPRAEFPRQEALAARVRALAESLSGEELRRHMQEILPLRHMGVLALALESLEELAAEGLARPRELLAAGRWPAELEPLLYFLLETLERQGLARPLEAQGQGGFAGRVWRLERPDYMPAFAELWRTLMADDPQGAAEMRILSRAAGLLSGESRRIGGVCGPNRYNGAACAETRPAEDEGGDPLLEQYFCFSPALRRNNALAAEAVRACLEAAPQGTLAHLLEIGAAPGGLLRAMLPLALEKDCIYTVTDANQAALEQMRGRISIPRGSRMAFRALDLLGGDAGVTEKPRPAHCLLLGYCLHAMDNTAAALRRCRELLVPGGLLALAELSPGTFADLAFGLQARWWDRSPAPDQPASRLLPPQAWLEALEQAGFEDPRMVYAGEGRGDTPEAFVLLARAPQEAAGSAAPASALPEAGGAVQPICAALSASAAQPAPVPAQTAEAGRGRVLLLRGNRSAKQVETLLNGLRRNLEEQGLEVLEVRPGKASFYGRSWRLNPESAAHWEKMWRALASDQRPVICMHALGLEKADPGNAAEAAIRQAQTLIQLARGWNAAGRPSLRLSLLTSGARPGPNADPAAFCALGAARVLMNEMPGLDLRGIDLESAEQADARDAAEALIRELLHPDAEREVLLSGRARYGARLRQIPLQGAGGTATANSGLRLQCRLPGHLETLEWKPVNIDAPPPGGVLVRVRATGLNFRDVMWAMGLLPDEALEKGFSGAGLGIECAGEVRAVGSGVQGLNPGQRVVCFGPHCFGTHVRTTAEAVAPIPPGWSFAQAASVPVAFFTAWYALSHLARMEPGERVLIHGAAGGVGLAAVQAAAHLGLEIFAAAGTGEKRRLLRLLGAPHVLDSRSYAFREHIMDLTGGQGVDAVLNSLAGEGMAKSLDVLRPFGRFLELGKRDLYGDSPLYLRPFRNNISFFGIDVDQLMRERPSLGQKLFREVMQLFADGVWRPLPHTVFAGHEAEQAFRAMQQSRHIGKIVLEPPSPGADAAMEPAFSAARSAPASALTFAPPTPAIMCGSRAALRVMSARADGSYIITGGLGGFGLSTARFLADLGAGALILVGRSGAHSPEDEKILDNLRASGRMVREVRADVTRRAQLRAALDESLRDLPPLRGIAHAAAVLDDSTVAGITPARLRRVLEPKIAGAVHLHEYSLGERGGELDFFIMYSSAVTLMGNPGQAAYVAANMALEGLAAMRRAMGLPGLAVGWGAIGDRGMLARDPSALQSLGRLGGITAMSAQAALGLLPALCAMGGAACAVAAADWRKICRLPVGVTPRLEELRPETVEAAGDAPLSLRESLEGKSTEQALEIITSAVTSAVGSVLRVAPSSIRPAAPLADMGMDSLMAVELGLALEEMLGCPPPAESLSAGASVRDIAESLRAFLLGNNEVADSSLRRRLESLHGVSVNDAFARAVLENTEARP